MQIRWLHDLQKTAIAAASTKRATKSHFRFATHATHALLSLLLLLCFNGGSIPCSPPALCHAIDYTYSHFAGPVVGPEQKVYVYDARSGGTRLDYVAKPAYAFAYGVEDTETRVSHNREEMRDGDAVQGMYSVVDPDGNLRVVKYTADNVNGFQAQVTTNGLPHTNHGHYQPPGKDNEAHYRQLPTTTANGQQEQHEPTRSKHASDGAAANNDAVADGGDGDGNDDDTGVEDYEDVRSGYEVHEEHEQHDGEQRQNETAADNDDSNGSSSSEEGYEDASQEAHSYEESASDEDY